ncbi:MAG: hypothetical protein ACKOZT_10900, partial [Cyanobium sp.]
MAQSERPGDAVVAGRGLPAAAERRRKQTARLSLRGEAGCKQKVLPGIALFSQGATPQLSSPQLR